MPEPRKPRDRSGPGGLPRESQTRREATRVPSAVSGTGAVAAGAGSPTVPPELIEPEVAAVRSPRAGPAPTPRWWVPVMVTIMIVGLLWIVVFYLSGASQWPVPQIGPWNLGVGFALIIAGFAMTTRWR